MVRSPDFEKGRDAINALLRDFGQTDVGSLNEAETRFQIIDRLLMECLDWDRPDIEVERYSDGEFTDYELGRPAPLAVLEAKREGSWFELPAGFSKRSIGIKELVNGNNALENGVKQALQYGQARGIAVAVLSNGHQLVAFLASRTDGKAPLDGRALVFASIEDMASGFGDLWNALAAPGLESGQLYRMLDADAVMPPPARLSARLLEYPGYKNRNELAAELQVLGGMFIEDIVRDPEVEPDFLTSCYCSSGALSQYALVSREILESRYSALLEKESGVVAEAAESKSGVTQDLVVDLFAANLGKRPVILLGDVGVGKTMFTRHFIFVEAATVLEKSIVLYVDFGSKPALTSELNNYVVKEFIRQLDVDYAIDVYESKLVRSVYRSELQKFQKGIYGLLKELDPDEYRRKEIAFLEDKTRDSESHLSATLEHLQKAQSRQTVVFLDNIDQRPFEFQEEVFLIAQSLAATWPVTSFVALRPETFNRSKAEGSLTGYQPRVFTIAPPRVDRVIQKRLAFARDQLQVQGRLPTFPEGVSVQSDRLDIYIEVLEQAFQDNKDIVELVENLSGGNVRRALDFVVSFVGSGHVDAQKIFRILEQRGRYTLPRHEFLRSIMYGEHEHYDPSDSLIANVFDVSSDDGREHFLLPMLLGFVERAGTLSEEQGFVTTGEVFAFAQRLGFRPHQIQFALERAVGKYLVETHPRRGPNEDSPSAVATRYRITSAGAYSAKRLVQLFTYLDAVVVDTPIINRKWRELVHEASTITERLNRVELFIDYLDSEWEKLTDDLSDLPWHWPEYSAAVCEEIRRIRTQTDASQLPFKSHN